VVDDYWLLRDAASCTRAFSKGSGLSLGRSAPSSILMSAEDCQNDVRPEPVPGSKAVRQ
jgi:hypothetical protein